MSAYPHRRARRSCALLAPLAAALTVILLTSCGAPGASNSAQGGSEAQDNATAVYEKYATITGDERDKQLYEEAKATNGGEITIYTSNSTINDIVKGFQDKYPGLTVNANRAEPAAFMQRFFQEQEAGRYQVDIVEDADASVVTKRGLAGKYANEPLTSQIRDLEAVQGNFTPTRGGAVVVSWNTNKVNESEIPANLEDFTDPKWKGRLSITDGEWAWYMTLSKQGQAEGKSQEEIDKMFETLASYSTIVNSHTLQAELLAAGEFDVALTTFNHATDQLADDGAPVAWRRSDGSPAVKPVVFGPEGAVPVINAPNPAGALLFIDYMLTDGQRIIADKHRPTSIPQDANDPLAGAELLAWPQDEYLNNRQHWESRFSEFMKLGTASAQ
jgi:iron(III) transport system substrate-binding protein